MRWLLIIIPITAFASSGDETVLAIGFLILSLAATIYKAKRYTDGIMKDNMQTLADVKPAIVAAVTGGAVTFTATNVISLAGMCVGVAGLVIGFLQWRVNKRNELINEANMVERKRTNDLKEAELRGSGIDLEKAS